MFLAKVKGHVVAPQKDASLTGARLTLVEPLTVSYQSKGGTLQGTNRALVAVDRIGSGVGQTVLITQGSSARLVEGCQKMPIDAVVVGLVSDATVDGMTVEGLN